MSRDGSRFEPADDWTTPLGQHRPRRRAVTLAVPLSPMQAVTAILGGALALFVLWATMADDPLGGEPVAVAPIVEQPATATAAASTSPPRADAPTRPAQTAADPVTTGSIPGGSTITIIDGSSGKRQEVVVPPPDASTARAGRRNTDR